MDAAMAGLSRVRSRGRRRVIRSRGSRRNRDPDSHARREAFAERRDGRWGRPIRVASPAALSALTGYRSNHEVIRVVWMAPSRGTVTMSIGRLTEPDGTPKPGPSVTVNRTAWRNNAGAVPMV